MKCYKCRQPIIANEVDRMEVTTDADGRVLARFHYGCARLSARERRQQALLRLRQEGLEAQRAIDAEQPREDDWRDTADAEI